MWATDEGERTEPTAERERDRRGAGIILGVFVIALAAVLVFGLLACGAPAVVAAPFP